MWKHILSLGDFKKVETDKGIAITSLDGNRRYYYQEGEPEHILLMYNASTTDGNDPTVDYLRKFNPNFSIVNLIPTAARTPGKLGDSDLAFDPVNFRVIKELFNRTDIIIWAGWGGDIKGKTHILFPIELRDLLQVHKKRLFQIDRGKPRAIYPRHPSYAKLNVPVDKLKLAPFDVKHVLKYP